MQLFRCARVALCCATGYFLLFALPLLAHLVMDILPAAKVAVYLPILQTLVIYACACLLTSLFEKRWTYLSPNTLLRPWSQWFNQSRFSDTSILVLQLIFFAVIVLSCHLFYTISLSATASAWCQTILTRLPLAQLCYSALLLLIDAPLFERQTALYTPNAHKEPPLLSRHIRSLTARQAPVPPNQSNTEKNNQPKSFTAKTLGWLNIRFV